MTFDPQDPQWTAYVLGELDEQERAAVEQQLAASPAARQFVDELRKTVGQVDAAMQTEPAARLTDEQLASVLAEVAKPVEPIATRLARGRSHRSRPWLLLAIAASLLVVVIIGTRTYQLPSGQWKTTAMDTTPFTTNTEIDRFDLGTVPLDPTELNTDSLTIKAPEVAALNINPSFEGHVVNSGVEAKGAMAPALNGRYLKATGAGDTKSGGENGTSGQSGSYAAPSSSEANPVADLVLPISPASSGDRAGAGANPSFVSGGPGGSGNAGGRYGAAGTGGGGTAGGSGAGGYGGSAPGPSAGSGPAPVNSPTPHAPSNFQGRAGGRLQTAAATPAPIPANLNIGLNGARQDAPQSFGSGAIPEFPTGSHAALVDAEDYTAVADNPFRATSDNPLSTFSVDVDTAAYANLRRFLLQNRQLPPPAAVRIEELINYFHYDYPQPAENVPFAVVTEVAGCPWNAEHRLLRIGIKGRDMASESRPASNLVFLIDVSGSMNSPNKLPLVKEALRLLVGQLHENDRVAVVVYAGNSGLVLPSTTADQRDKILAAIDNLSAGGSTNGGQGIQLAYDIAAGNFIKGGTNRVILATDGDFNVGITDHESLVKLIEDKAKSGVFLTTLGFGMGNLKDSTLEQLADKGNGNYAYIDGIREARKVFVEQMTGTLVTIAKDVKLQLEFNPAQVGSYRLIGYENRVLRHEDFNNDKKDAGDIGAGHTVTALFELVPAGKADSPAVDPLKYQRPTNLTDAAKNGEIVTLKLRYKQPDGDKSQLIEQPVTDSGKGSAAASVDFKFASAVALFGMLLRDSPYHGTASFDVVQQLAQEGRGSDLASYRAEFMQLVAVAKQLRENK